MLSRTADCLFWLGRYSERAGNVAQNGLYHDHALRATKAAKRRVALRVCLAAVRGDFYVAQVIGVVGVEHRTVGHGA